MSFQEAYEEFLIFAKKRQKKQSFDCLNYNFNANILSFFKDYNIFDIKANDIFLWQDYILKKDFGNNHNKNLYSMLKKFFDFCKLKYNLSLEFMLDVVPFSLKIEKKRKIDFYTLKEFKRFIKFVDNIIYKSFFNFMFFCGTRPGEAMALKFSDLNGYVITINKTMDEHGKRDVGTPKTHSSNREILIPKKLLRSLIKLRKYYIKKYSDSNFDYFIFGGKKPLAPTTINRYKLKACEKAKLRSITLHQFRHSHATLLVSKGIDIHDVSARLGHAKASTTLNVYTHSLKQKRVLKTLNKFRFNIF